MSIIRATGNYNKNEYYDESTKMCNFHTIINDVSDITDLSGGLQLYDSDNKLLTSGKPKVLRRKVEIFNYGFNNYVSYNNGSLVGQIYPYDYNMDAYHNYINGYENFMKVLQNYINADSLMLLHEWKQNRPRILQDEYIDSSKMSKDDYGVDIKMKLDNPEKYPYDVLDTQSSANGLLMSKGYAVTKTRCDCTGDGDIVTINFNNNTDIELQMSYVYDKKKKYYIPHLNVPYYIVTVETPTNRWICNEDGTINMKEFANKNYARTGSIYKVTYSLEEVK